MTREEQVNICRCCEHHKLDMRKGIVCKKTGEPATFDGECPDYSGSNETTNTTISTEPAEIKGFFAFYLYWSIPIGILVTLFRSLVSYDSASYLGSDFLLWTDIILTLVYTYLGIYVIYAFIKQRSDAVFMAKYQLLYLFLSNVLVIAVGEAESMTFSSIIWSIIFFLYVCFSEDVKDRIPKETRKLTKINRYFVPASVAIPIICLLLGIVEIAQGYSFFSNPKEKLEDLCLATQSTLPDGELHSMYIEDNAVVYGLDASWGALTSTTIERLGITLREAMLDDFTVDADTKEFFDLCVEAEHDITYKFTDTSSGTCVTVTIPYEQLSDVMEYGYEHTVSTKTWDAALELYNEELPRLYFEDCYLENVSINPMQNRIRYDLNLIDVSVATLNSFTDEFMKYHIKSNFELLSDDITTLVGISGYDMEYSFSADCLSWWNKSVVIEYDEIFE